MSKLFSVIIHFALFCWRCLLVLVTYFQDVLDHETQHDESSAFELIRCHLTLFYTYWSMSEVP
jgi:hypothetical protein